MIVEPVRNRATLPFEIKEPPTCRICLSTIGFFAKLGGWLHCITKYYEPLNSSCAAKVFQGEFRKMFGAGVLRSEVGGEFIPAASSAEPAWLVTTEYTKETEKHNRVRMRFFRTTKS